MYKLEFLPVAKNDMLEIIKYISERQCNKYICFNTTIEVIEGIEDYMRRHNVDDIHDLIGLVK